MDFVRHLQGVRLGPLPSYDVADNTLAIMRSRFGFKEVVTPLFGETTKTDKNPVPTRPLPLQPAESAMLRWDPVTKLVIPTHVYDKGRVISRDAGPSFDIYETVNACRYKTSCDKICVAFSGNGKYPSTQLARSWKSGLLLESPLAFMVVLAREIIDFRRELADAGEEFGLVRLNAFTDIPYETFDWFWPIISDTMFRDVLENIDVKLPPVYAYDYTKWPRDRRSGVEGYMLSYSATEHWTLDDVESALADGHQVTLVASPIPEAPTSFHGLPAVDGDVTDFRPNDGPVVVLLRPKGDLRGQADHPFVWRWAA